MKIFLVLIYLFFSQAAYACHVSINTSIEAKEAYIKNANFIQLVEVTEFIETDNSYKFKVKTQESIKGQPKDYIELVKGGYPISKTFEGEKDYYQHLNPLFWSTSSSFSTYNDKCQVTRKLSVGESYLIILGSEGAKNYSFENVYSSKDIWYQFVKAVDEGKDYNAVLNIFIESFKKAAFSIDTYIKDTKNSRPRLVKPGIHFEDYNSMRPNFNLSGFMFTNEDILGFDLYHFSKNPTLQIMIPFGADGVRNYSYLNTVIKIKTKNNERRSENDEDGKNINT